MTLCPTPRLIDKMLFHYKEMNDAVDLSYPEKVQFATTLKINPEPIVLQVRINLHVYLKLILVNKVSNCIRFFTFPKITEENDFLKCAGIIKKKFVAFMLSRKYCSVYYYIHWMPPGDTLV